MTKGMNTLLDSLNLDRKGTFEYKWAKHIDEFDIHGTTVKRKMYESDEKERYFHIYHSSTKEGNERALLSKKLCQMKVHMKKHINEVIQFGSGFEHYFRIHYF